MKCAITLIFCFIFSFSWAQNQHKGIIVDTESKEPIEFVTVFNQKNSTITNVDGRFVFSSSKDSVIFYRVGYDKLTATFSQLKDTIFLNKSVFKLNEVVVTNAKSIYQKIKDSLFINYRLTPHTEKFVMRALLKKNDSIVRIQDVQGKVNRKTSIYTGTLEPHKNDYKVELTNLRKIGITRDNEDVYFQFPTFYNIFSEFVRINAMGIDFDVVEKPFENGRKTLVEFNSVASISLQYITKGHYIINNDDNAILSFYVLVDGIAPLFRKSKNIRTKLLKQEVHIFFKKDTINTMYYIDYGKRNAIVEITDENGSYTNTYEMTIILDTTKSFGDFKVKSNINEHKDIFKLKYPYNSEYWTSQNQLILTDEMQVFIKRIGEDNKKFKVRSVWSETQHN